MKIKEITEDTNTGTPESAPNIQQAVKTWIDEWNNEVRSNPLMANNLGALQNYATQLARDKNGNQLFTPPPPTGTAPQQVTQYITSIVKSVLNMTSPSAEVARTAQQSSNAKQIINQLITQAEIAGDRISYSDINKILTTSGMITAQMDPADRRQTITNIAQLLKGHGIEIVKDLYGTAPGTNPILSQGVGVISSDPVVLQYDKRKYALNSQNRWVIFGSTKSASPEMERFLNKQLQVM